MRVKDLIIGLLLAVITCTAYAQDENSASRKVKKRMEIDIRPAVVYQPISDEMADEAPNPMLMRLPSMWNLIVGYDELANTYVIDSHASKGRFTVGWNTFGNNDRSRKFCVVIVKPRTTSFDTLKPLRTTIRRAIEAAQGMRPANTTEATAHGLAAWEMWYNAFQRKNVSTGEIKHHANFLKRSRGWAIAFLNGVAHHFPEDARIPLHAAIKHYEAVTAAMDDMLNLEPYDAMDIQEGTKILSRALENERAALANLQKVLDKSEN